MNKLNYQKIFLLGFGFFAVSITWSVYNAFMPKILSNFIHSATLIGFIMTIDNYLALFIQPAVGLKSDKISTRFGKRMPFIMVGMPLATLFLVLLANYHNLATLLVFLVLMNLSMSVFRSPVIALMPDLTYSEHRSKANSVINLMGGIGAVIAYFAGSLLWDKSQKYPFYLAAALMAVSFFVLYTFIKEKRDVTGYESSSGRVKIGLLEGLRASGNAKNVIYLLLAICTWFIGYQGVEAFLTLYGVNLLGLKTSVAAMSFTFISLSFLLFAFPAGIMGAKFGKKKTIIAGVAGIIISFAVLALLRNLLAVRAVLVVTGFFWALININSYPFVADMAPEGQTGVYTGLYYLASSVAAIVSPPLLGALIDTAGYAYMFAYASVCFVLALVFILKVKEVKPGNVVNRTVL